MPYCVGSELLSAAENKVVNTFGKLQPAINAVSEAKLNALGNVANEFNSTLNRAKSAVENQCEEDSGGTEMPSRDSFCVLILQRFARLELNFVLDAFQRAVIRLLRA